MHNNKTLSIISKAPNTEKLIKTLGEADFPKSLKLTLRRTEKKRENGINVKKSFYQRLDKVYERLLKNFGKRL